MPSITIKNIPDDLSEELKVAAKTHRRSINNEVIMMLEEKLVPQKTSREELQKRARECFETNRELGIYVTQEELDEAINQGRPGWAKMLVVRLSLILISSPIFSCPGHFMRRWRNKEWPLLSGLFPNCGAANF